MQQRIGANAWRCSQAAYRLPPEPGVARGWRISAARRELFFEIPDDEVAPLGGQPPGQQPDREPRRIGSLFHFSSSRLWRPSAIAVKARYAWRMAAKPAGRSA